MPPSFLSDIDFVENCTPFIEISKKSCNIVATFAKFYLYDLSKTCIIISHPSPNKSISQYFISML